MKKIKMNFKNKKAITLISLVVTIIVLIILAGVSISLVLGNNGLVTKAKDGAKNYQIAANEESSMLANIESILDANISGNEKGYVGYYADVDGNGTVDGVIYADLAVSVSGQWSNDWGDYSYSTTSNLKEYTISQQSYNGSFGTKPVIKVANNTGVDRFYVMALKDVALDGTSTADKDSIYWNWYYSAGGNLDEAMNIPSDGEGSNDFGQGRSKTQTMIGKWNQEAYGAKNAGETYKEVWGIFNHTNNTLGTVDSSKWFIPSKGEWSAFGGNLGITTGNYASLGLSDWYWSSSQDNAYSAYCAFFCTSYMNYFTVEHYGYVRLSTTF